MSTPPDQRPSIYACDCGYECTTDRALQQHQQTNCRNRSVECSFCEETFPTSNALKEHLVLCGNKTDECPRCRQFIRRSHFAYHYQNNCASVNEVETPPNQRRLQISPRSPVNPNLPVERTDVPSDDYFSQRNRRAKSAEPHKKPIQLIIRCEYCQQPCAQNDYARHKINCLRNPANIKNRQQERRPLLANQNCSPPNGIIHIPCEICNAPVDLPNWSNHVQSCRERENERIKKRARSMSAEPVNERLPCEYCEQLFPGRELQPHQRACQRNPSNKRGQAQNGRPRQDVHLPIKYTPGNDQAARPALQSPRDEVHYGKIDHEETRKANGLPNDSQFNQRTNDKTPLLHRSTSADSAPDLNASPSPGHIYGNDHRRSRSRDRSEKSAVKVERRPSPNDKKVNRRSSMEKLRDIGPNEDRRVPVGDNRLPSKKSQKGVYKNGKTSGSFEVINNDDHTPLTNKDKKPSRLKAFFGCAANGVYE